MDYRELYQKAAAVLPNAFVPFSNYRVGAALLTKSGEVFTGVNVENSSYGGAICAERTACVKAVSEGFHEFEAIAVAGESGEAAPCGICRQFLYEFAPDLTVIFAVSTNAGIDSTSCFSKMQTFFVGRLR